MDTVTVTVSVTYTENAIVPPNHHVSTFLCVAFFDFFFFFFAFVGSRTTVFYSQHCSYCFNLWKKICGCMFIELNTAIKWKVIAFKALEEGMNSVFHDIISFDIPIIFVCKFYSFFIKLLLPMLSITANSLKLRILSMLYWYIQIMSLVNAAESTRWRFSELSRQNTSVHSDVVS